MLPKGKNHLKISLQLLLLPGFSLLSMGVLLEGLLSLQSIVDGEKSLTFSWDFIALDNEAVSSACGTQVKTSLTLDSLEMVSGVNHYLIIFGSKLGMDDEQLTFSLKPLIEKALNKRIVIVCMDGAVFLLAKDGYISEHTMVAFNASRSLSEHYTFESIPAHTGVFNDGDIWLCTGGNAASRIAELIAQKRKQRISEIKKLSTEVVRNETVFNTFRDIPSSLPPQVASTLQFIKNNLATSLDPDFIASRCGLSRRTLDLLMTRETGRTVKQTIVHLRTDYACHLLVQKTKSLKEVAKECGFESISQFSRLFKKRTGLTPAAWRYDAYLNLSSQND